MTAAQLALAGRGFLDTDPRRLLEASAGLAGNSSVDSIRAILANSGQDLEIEYVRLFLNPAGAPCPPWQSAHEEEGRLMGRAHVSALRWYASYEASPKATTEPADHVGLLLMFYGQLMSSGAGQEELTGFASEHLDWIPAFAERVSRESRHEFYKELGRWTSQLVNQQLSDRRRSGS